MQFRHISIRTLASGHSLKIPVYTFTGKNTKAPKAYIQAGIHGAELQGHAVIAELLTHFKKNPPLGDITLVPLANPFGMDQKVGEYTQGRFDPTTGDNWNRGYWLGTCSSESSRTDEEQIVLEDFFAEKNSGPERFRTLILQGLRKKLTRPLPFARRLALQLQSLAFRADFVLDLHNANESVNYLYSPDYALEDAKAFGCKYILSMPPKFGGALDEAFFVTWSEYWREAGALNPTQQSFTLELGHQEKVDLVAAKRQAEGILNYLRKKSVISGRTKNTGHALVCAMADYKTIYAPEGGLYHYADVLGRICKAGTNLATRVHFDKSGSSLQNVTASTVLLPILHYSSAAVHEGDELFKVFTRWHKI